MVVHTMRVDGRHGVTSLLGLLMLLSLLLEQGVVQLLVVVLVVVQLMSLCMHQDRLLSLHVLLHEDLSLEGVLLGSKKLQLVLEHQHTFIGQERSRELGLVMMVLEQVLIVVVVLVMALTFLFVATESDVINDLTSCWRVLVDKRLKR